jgi:hypothetical protein
MLRRNVGMCCPAHLDRQVRENEDQCACMEMKGFRVITAVHHLRIRRIRVEGAMRVDEEFEE